MVAFVDSAVSAHCRQLSACSCVPVVQLGVCVCVCVIGGERYPQRTIHPAAPSEANWGLFSFCVAFDKVICSRDPLVSYQGGCGALAQHDLSSS